MICMKYAKTWMHHAVLKYQITHLYIQTHKHDNYIMLFMYLAVSQGGLLNLFLIVLKIENILPAILLISNEKINKYSSNIFEFRTVFTRKNVNIYLFMMISSMLTKGSTLMKECG